MATLDSIKKFFAATSAGFCISSAGPCKACGTNARAMDSLYSNAFQRKIPTVFTRNGTAQAAAISGNCEPLALTVTLRQLPRVRGTCTRDDDLVVSLLA